METSVPDPRPEEDNACCRQWTEQDGSFVLLAERGYQAVGYSFVEIQAGPDDT
ncbi:hypothetical protein [Streptomyces sp. NPDC001508]|uniref:hypothetical protein n=1 Tax=Streptomyces sp. NPDC001508 TaxID=3154656 RepID=UPI0033305701